MLKQPPLLLTDPLIDIVFELIQVRRLNDIFFATSGSLIKQNLNLIQCTIHFILIYNRNIESYEKQIYNIV